MAKGVFRFLHRGEIRERKESKQRRNGGEKEKERREGMRAREIEEKRCMHKRALRRSMSEQERNEVRSCEA